MYKCQKYFKFVDCLEHYLKKLFHEREQEYVPHMPEIDLIVETDNELISNNNREANGMQQPAKLLKRSGANQDELISFFRNAIAKNMKLKTNIKTTRF